MPLAPAASMQSLNKANPSSEAPNASNMAFGKQPPKTDEVKRPDAKPVKEKPSGRKSEGGEKDIIPPKKQRSDQSATAEVKSGGARIYSKGSWILKQRANDPNMYYGPEDTTAGERVYEQATTF
jgi:hypothetical protein